MSEPFSWPPDAQARHRMLIKQTPSNKKNGATRSAEVSKSNQSKDGDSESPSADEPPTVRSK